MGDTNATSAEARPLIHLDVDGDLRLDVGEDEEVQRFKVCSRTLSRASKVFKAMLYGNFIESRPSNKEQEWVVALPEDDPVPLATVLYIVHNQFSKVPDSVTREELFNITVLTDKYDMTEVLRPWAKSWIKPLASGSRPLGQKGDEALLWIAWELGHVDLFQRTLGHLQETCTLDQHSKVLDRHGTRLEDNDHVKALGILGGKDGLETRRISRISSLLFCVDTKVNYLARGIGDIRSGSYVQECCPVSIFGQSTHLERCNIWYLGSIIRSLAKVSYYPLPNASWTKCSVQEVRTKLGSVCDGILHNGSNKACCPDSELRSSLAKVSTDILLTDVQTKHLEQQAVKTGLPTHASAPQQAPVLPSSVLFTNASGSLFPTGSYPEWNGLRS